MASLTLCRSAFRRSVLPLSLTLGTGIIAIQNQRPMRLDAAQARPYANDYKPPQRKDHLNPEIIKQLSGGSLSGFLAGLLVSVFSKTLVLVAGIAIVAIQVAARSGLNLVEYFKLKERVRSSRILAALERHTAFKLAFGVAFSLSAFMSF